MSGKIQIWLPEDEATFAISCLHHLINRIDAGASINGNENVKFACRSTSKRAQNIISIISSAIAKRNSVREAS